MEIGGKAGFRYANFVNEDRMSTHVYANGNEISCKAADGKTSTAFPDPCWSPPPPPAGPVVLPYPNTASPSSLKKGSSTVLIKRSAVALTDRSYFSTSIGNEPATPAFMKGFLTKKLKGKTYYQQWSMNVKVEGKGVCRNFDIMTHNHGSFTGNTAPFPFIDGTAMADTSDDPCLADKKNIKDKCNAPEEGENWNTANCPKEFNGYAKDDSALKKQVDAANNKDSCVNALKCRLIPYDDGKKQDGGGCCNGQTPHHLLADSMFKPCGLGRTDNSPFSADYKCGAAPNICMEGSDQHSGSHQELHQEFAFSLLKHMEKNKKPALSPMYPTTISLDEAMDLTAQNVEDKYGCKKKCIQAQLDQYYIETCKMDKKEKVYTIDENGNKYACKSKSDTDKSKIDQWVEKKQTQLTPKPQTGGRY